MDAPIDKGLRKYRLAVLGMGLVFGGFLLCEPWGAGRDLFGTLCAGISGLATLFIAGNVAEHHVTKTRASTPKATE